MLININLNDIGAIIRARRNIIRTYAQRGRGVVKPNAYDCVQAGGGDGGGVQGCVDTAKSQNFSFFFVKKKLLLYHLLWKSVNQP